MEQNNDNVYAPPVARVADPEPEKILSKPTQVRVAIWLLWAAIGMAIMASWINTFMVLTYVTVPSIMKLFFTSTIILTFNGWIIYKISSGRNWARIWKLITSSLSVVGFIAVIAIKNTQPEIYSKYFQALDQQPTGSKIISWVNLVLLVVVMLLLFTKPGSDWFRKRSE